MKTTLTASLFALSLALVPALFSAPAQAADHTTQFAASCTKGCFADGTMGSETGVISAVA
jgi:hypothetical protein